MYDGEKLNSITHLIGAAFSLIGLGALLAIGIQKKDILLTISFAIFGFTLVLLYTMSTLYHSFPPTRIKSTFQKLDHISIYLLIAGTYTPYMLILLRDHGGLIVLTLIWLLAIIGLLIDIFIRKRIEWLQIIIYLFMGWLCVVNYDDLSNTLPKPGLIWLTAGGIAYTAGIIFYVLDNLNKLKHAHGIWHVFVLTGSLCHFISISVYVR